jgi:hypothetical protein
VAEIVLLSFSLTLDLRGDLNIAELIFQALRILLFVGLFGLVFGLKILKIKKIGVDEETTTLLNQNDPVLSNLEGAQTVSNGTAYGSCNTSADLVNAAKVKSSSGPNAKRNGPANDGALWTCIKSFRVSLPLYLSHSTLPHCQ